MKNFTVTYEVTTFCTASFPAENEAEARELTETGRLPMGNIVTTGRTTDITVLSVEEV